MSKLKTRMPDKAPSITSKPDPKESDFSLENTLREFLHPVKPRNEFVNSLQGKLEEEILPIQKKRVVPLYTFVEVFLRTIALFVITVLTVRAVMVIITSWKFIRTAGAR